MHKKNLESLSLLQGYYTFLYLGGFLDTMIREKDYSSQARDTKIQTGENSSFLLKKDKIQHLLESFHKQWSSKNLFGYMVEINGLRGVFSTMRELLDNDKHFHSFIKKTLWKQFFPFEQIIIFVRNVLTHTQEINPVLDRENIVRQKTYLFDKNIQSVVFSFRYAEHIDEWSWSSDYGINASLHFKKIRQGNTLFDIVPLHTLYLMAELCFNLCEIYKQH